MVTPYHPSIFPMELTPDINAKYYNFFSIKGKTQVGQLTEVNSV